MNPLPSQVGAVLAKLTELAGDEHVEVRTFDDDPDLIHIYCDPPPFQVFIGWRTTDSLALVVMAGDYEDDIPIADVVALVGGLVRRSAIMERNSKPRLFCPRWQLAFTLSDDSMRRMRKYGSELTDWESTLPRRDR